MELNSGQQIAVEKFAEYYRYPNRRKRPWFELSGPAGTGKTTVVREAMNYIGIPEELTAFMAFVGKATLALRRTGLDAHTIHYFIYQLVVDYLKDENGDIVYDKGKPQKIKTFRLRDELEKDYKLGVIDEGGMVGYRMGTDLLSFGMPLWVLGDLCQLPPVMDKRIFLKEPDVELTQIMRQEKDSPIIYLSQLASHGIPIPYGNYGTCRVIPKNALVDEDLAHADMIICGTNEMRDTINKYIRKNIYHITENHIVPGDKLICRQNKWDIQLNRDISLVNGLVGYVEKVNYNSKSTGSDMDIAFRPEFYQNEMFNRIGIIQNYPFKPYQLRKETGPSFGSGGVKFEFGYCITCHLAQGSQADNVIVYVEKPSNSLYFRQWLYTAITRAIKNVTIVI